MAVVPEWERRIYSDSDASLSAPVFRYIYDCGARKPKACPQVERRFVSPHLADFDRVPNVAAGEIGEEQVLFDTCLRFGFLPELGEAVRDDMLDVGPGIRSRNAFSRPYLGVPEPPLPVPFGSLASWITIWATSSSRKQLCSPSTILRDKSVSDVSGSDMINMVGATGLEPVTSCV